MPRIALVNLSLGFFCIFFAAAAGAFISQNISDRYYIEPTSMQTWSDLLLQSAHGHTNLFGLLQIVFGLTIPYSIWNKKIICIQTIGFFLGILAMSLGMIIKARFLPAPHITLIDIFLGVGLSAALLSVGSHGLGLMLKLMKNKV